MKKYYVIDAFRFHKEYDNLTAATAEFEAIAKNFSYCELKQVWEDGKAYYAQSLKISHKKG